MNRINPDFLNLATQIVGDGYLKTNERALASGSKDCFHFSPVLIPQLENCQADAIAFPQTQQQLVELIDQAVRADIPIIPRGGGTGNYGQGVPMHGGLMINTRKMNRVIEMTKDFAHVEAGTSLWTIERDSAEVGGELRMFPSTIGTSTAAGFIAGGSGGIGSIKWGMLRDAGNIRSAKILTAEANPQSLLLDTPEKLRDILHNCGLTAFITEVCFSLAEKTDWHQYVFAFDDFEDALETGIQLACDKHLNKRLTTVFESPVPSYFMPLKKKGACPDGKSLLFLITDLAPEAMADYIKDYSCVQTFYLSPEDAAGKNKPFQIYDFTWNHTTQWAMKSDPKLTYLQEGFDINRISKQIAERKRLFGDQVKAHIEFMAGPNDEIRAGGLSVVDFRGKDQLWELIQASEDLGIQIANPHTHFLDEDIRWYGDNFLSAKQRWDPKHLLNPGHLHSLEGMRP